jgi:hypothetical protein
LYYEQWLRLLDVAGDLRTFLEENKNRLKLKSETRKSFRSRLGRAPENARTVNPVQTTGIFGIWKGASANAVDAEFPL